MSKSNRRSTKPDASALAERLSSYGGRVVRVTTELPDTKAGRHIRDQLLRSATAPGAHYAEARSAQSDSDFVHKVGLAAKEARESLHWLQVARGAQMVDNQVESLTEEADELVAILFSSLQTARVSQSTSAEQ